MRSMSIRVRLTIWYSCLLGAALVVFSVVAMLLMQHSISESVDEELRHEAEAVQALISSTSEPELREQVRTHAELQAGSSLLQVTDENGYAIYQSPRLKKLRVPSPAAEPGRFVNREFGRTPLRIYSSNLSTSTHVFHIEVAADMDDYVEAASHYRILLSIGIPLLLCAAAAGGYWLSSRALAPVEQITNFADNISPHDLAARVEMPRTRDELYRLAETLNALLQRIESAFRRITQFTADASHELRTPVSLIRTQAEIALRRNRSEEEYRAALTEIMDEAKHVSALIEDLMLLARADTDSHTLRFNQLDMTELVRQVARQGHTLAEVRQLQWSLQVPDGPLWLRGDREALRRLLLILIDNAVKYTPGHGSVSVTLRNSDGMAHIDVEDTGIGIPHSEQPHIFERFYRADTARSRDSGGTGLGLAIAQWIAKAHHGNITVQSSEGRGSCFSVTLPQAV
jgi:heavy metal sensor kinase